MNRSRRFATVLLLAVAGPLSGSCQALQDSGVTRPKLVPDNYLHQTGLEAYEAETSKYPRITSGADYEMVQRLGARIAAASGHEADWEFRLLDAPAIVNAFALPGGKVAVYSGLLAVTQTEDALAAVVGHEVEHVILEHGNERMTAAYIAQGLLVGGDLLLEEYSDLQPDARGQAVALLGGVAQLGLLLPYSRLHETESDIGGLRYLVRAGYDPDAAPELWERMAELSADSDSDPWKRWTSTHPDPRERARVLREKIPAIVAEETGAVQP